jgi:hypothetical protein
MATPHSSIDLTPRGKVVLWLAGLAAGAAWIGGDDNARLAASMLAAPILIDFVAKQRHLHFTSVRLAARRTIAGTAYIENLSLEHQGRRPLRNCQFYEPRSMRSEPPVLLPTLQPFEPQRIDVRQRSLVRSHVLERVFVIESQWPLGMFATRSVISTETDLITEPMRVSLRADVLDAASDAEIAPVDRSSLPGPEFQALREHLPEEEARGVHALRSASVGTLIRRVTRGRMPRTIGIVLDLRRAPGQPRGRGMRRCEWSLGACASLVEELHRRGSVSRVLVVDTEPEQIEVKGAAQLTELMTLLSEASLSMHHGFDSELLQHIKSLSHCYWIPAGGFTHAPEMRDMPGKLTLIVEDEE